MLQADSDLPELLQTCFLRGTQLDFDFTQDASPEQSPKMSTKRSVHLDLIDLDKENKPPQPCPVFLPPQKCQTADLQEITELSIEDKGCMSIVDLSQDDCSMPSKINPLKSPAFKAINSVRPFDASKKKKSPLKLRGQTMLETELRSWLGLDPSRLKRDVNDMSKDTIDSLIDKRRDTSFRDFKKQALQVKDHEKNLQLSKYLDKSKFDFVARRAINYPNISTVTTRELLKTRSPQYSFSKGEQSAVNLCETSKEIVPKPERQKSIRIPLKVNLTYNKSFVERDSKPNFNKRTAVAKSKTPNGSFSLFSKVNNTMGINEKKKIVNKDCFNFDGFSLYSKEPKSRSFVKPEAASARSILKEMNLWPSKGKEPIFCSVHKDTKTHQHQSSSNSSTVSSVVNRLLRKHASSSFHSPPRFTLNSNM